MATADRRHPDGGRHDGVLLPFVPSDLAALLPDVATDKCSFKSVTMAKAALADGQALYAVNDLFVGDLFIGARSHTSALYESKPQPNTRRNHRAD
jgi:hypothetical protein